jgi:hypothetical protein
MWVSVIGQFAIAWLMALLIFQGGQTCCWGECTMLWKVLHEVERAQGPLDLNELSRRLDMSNAARSTA